MNLTKCNKKIKNQGVLLTKWTLEPVKRVHHAVSISGFNSYNNTTLNGYVNSPSALIRSVFIFCIKMKGLIIAHQMVVVLWDREDIRVYK